MKLTRVYLRIDRKRYHYLKFILEAYDGLCLLSTVPENKDSVCIRYPRELEKNLFPLLADLSGTIKLRTAAARKV